MFQNYSQTYAAAITTYAPLIALILGKFGVPILESDVIMILSALVGTVGFIWQLVHRFRKGGVHVAGGKIQ